MQELITMIKNDFTLMLITGVGFAVFLVIFLVLLISAMRVKSYKERYRKIYTENATLTQQYATLEKELLLYKITDEKNKKELHSAKKSITHLEEYSRGYVALQKTYTETVTRLKATKHELENSYAKYDNLEKNQEELQKKYDTLMGENSKYRSSNTRLLSKIENRK